MKVCTVAELIKEFGDHLPDRRCSNCGRPSLWLIGDRETGFVVCLLCDTTAEARKKASV